MQTGGGLLCLQTDSRLGGNDKAIHFPIIVCFFKTHQESKFSICEPQFLHLLNKTAPLPSVLRINKKTMHEEHLAQILAPHVLNKCKLCYVLTSYELYPQ